MTEKLPGDIWTDRDGDYVFLQEVNGDTGWGESWVVTAYYQESNAEYEDPYEEVNDGAIRVEGHLQDLIYRQFEDVTDEYDRVLERQGGFFGVPQDLYTNDGGFITKDSGVRAAYDSGMVRDTQEGKPRFDLMYPKNIPYKDQMLTRLGELLERGQAKYGTRNWELANSQEEIDRFEGSGLRHYMQWMLGETDEDHAAAVLFNVIAAESTKWKKLNENPNL